MEQDLIKVADEICFGCRSLPIDGYTYCYRPLKLSERNMADIIYQNALLEAKKHELQPRAILRAGALQSRLLTPIDELKLNQLKEKILKIEEELKAKDNKSLKKERDFYQKQFYILADLKYNLIDAPSQEYYAEQERNKYIVFCCTLTFPDLKSLWSSFTEFTASTQTDFISKLLYHYFNFKSIDEKLIRQIARAPYWRLKWIASNKNLSSNTLFYNSVSDLTLEQYQLIRWSLFYDSVYEAYDRPPQHIIENDTLLDEWYAKKIKEQEASSAKNFSLDNVSNKAKGNEVGITVHGYYSNQCSCKKLSGRHLNTCTYGVFIPYDKLTREKQIEAIQTSNPTPVRVILQQEYNQLSKQGSKKEQDLRKSKQVRSLLGMVQTNEK